MKCFKCLQEVPDDAEICPHCGQRLKPSNSDSSSVLQVSSLIEGDLIKDRFEIRELLGNGGIGTVFKVYDKKFDVISVIKMLNSEFADNPSIKKTFFDIYGEILENENENLAKVFEVDEYKEVPFIVEQYIEGMSLRKIIGVKFAQKSFFTAKEAFPIFEGIFKALEKIHPLDYHGDLKPENVLVSTAGIKLSDYGVSKIIPPDDFLSIQLTNGEPYYYLSSEYITTPNKIDYKVDIYALGIIIFELLTGEIPKEGVSPPSTLNNQLPPEIDRVILKAIDKNPEKRYCCIEDFFVEFCNVIGKEEKAKKYKAVVNAKLSEINKKKQKENKKSKQKVKPESLFDDVEEHKEEVKQKKSSTLFDEVLETEKQQDKTDDTLPLTEQTVSKKSKFPLFIGGGVIVAVIVILLIVFSGNKSTTDGVVNTETAKKATKVNEPPKQNKPAKNMQQIKPEEKENIKVNKKNIEDTIKNEVKKEQPLAVKEKVIKEKKESVSNDKYRIKYGNLKKKILVLNQKLAKEKILPELKKDVDKYNELIKEGDLLYKQTMFAKAFLKLKSANKVLSDLFEKIKKQGEKDKKDALAKKSQKCPSDMIYIPTGSFYYGTPDNDPEKDYSEKKSQKVFLKGYCIDKYEFPNKPGAIPIVKITLTQAQKSCTDQGKRLCSEAEWEKACKGPGNNKYPYGNTYSPGKCNSKESGKGKIMPSGSMSGCRSRYGVMDLSGNVLEWTVTPLDGGNFATKGASYKRAKAGTRCSARRSKKSSRRNNDLGFRCCKYIPK